MRVTVLGAIGVEADDGTSVDLGSRSQRLVLAVLAAHRGSIVRDDVLVDALWDDPPPSATRTLRSLVSRLRRSLGDRVRRRGDGYVLDVAVDELDSGRFDALVDRAHDAPAAEAEGLLGEALSWWRGSAYGEFADVDVIRSDASRLEERRRAARRARAEALLACGRAAEAAEQASALVAEQPLDEAAWVVLVRARAVSAPGEALRLHQRAVATLAEAGLEPTARLREAEAEALQGGPVASAPRPAKPAIAAPVRDVERPPAPRTSLVGRSDDLAAVCDLVARSRLVTVVGPGGVGKTRLGIEVARALADRHALGARMISLGEVRVGEDVAPAVVEALGITPEGDVADVLAHLGGLDLLVVLDNCEHVADAAAEVVDRLLDGGGQVRVLATSREPLGVAGEHRWSLGPLPSAHEGVQLFVDRARAVRPDLVVDASDEDVIARVVSRLDGLPLAIEMAAAMVATVGLEELDRMADGMLAALRSPTRHAPPRHRTLDAVVDWSVTRCTAEERRVFAELGVFEGSLSVDDAALVVEGDHDRVAGAMRTLAERSLLDVVVDGPRARYRMLETIRRHARRRLGPAADVHRRHAEHQLSVLVDADARLRQPDEAAAHEAIELAWPELRAAHRWAVDADPVLAEELSRRLHVWAVSRHRVDAFRWAGRLIDERGVGPAIAHTARAHAAVGAGRMQRALEAAELACTLGDDLDRLHALEARSDVAVYQGELAAAVVIGDELRRSAEAVGDLHFVAVGAAATAMAHAYAGRRDEALAALELGPALRLQAPSDLGWIEYTTGEALLDHEPDAAARHLRRAIEQADGVGNRLLGGVARLSLVSQEARRGEPTSAASTFVEVIDHWQRHGSLTHMVTMLRNLVVLLVRLGEPVAAAQLLGAIDARVDKPTFGEEAARVDAARAELAAALGAAVDDRFEEGARRRFDDVVADARALLTGLAAADGSRGPGGSRSA